MPLLMLSLMVGVIYLLHPLRLVGHSSNQSGLMLNLACLVEEVWDLHLTKRWWDPCRSLCLVRLRNNSFSWVSFLTGGNPIFGQQNPVQGTIPSQGATTGVYFTQGIWNP
jgi:hypothetical protein